MNDTLEARVAKALPCKCGEGSHHVIDCFAVRRPAVLALLREVVAEAGDAVKAEADKFVMAQPLISSILYFVEHLVRRIGEPPTT